MPVASPKTLCKHSLAAWEGSHLGQGLFLHCRGVPAMPTPPPWRAYTQPRHTSAQKSPADVLIFPVPCFNPILREHIKTRSENITCSPKHKNSLQTEPSVTRSVLHLNSRGHVYSKTTGWAFCKHFMAPLGHWVKTILTHFLILVAEAAACSLLPHSKGKITILWKNWN